MFIFKFKIFKKVLRQATVVKLSAFKDVYITVTFRIKKY